MAKTALAMTAAIIPYSTTVAPDWSSVKRVTSTMHRRKRAAPKWNLFTSSFLTQTPQQSGQEAL